ncbi:MAG TPA: DUF4242 domain-containing protein [Gemmatimonadaceae bacterium]|nr:DUF4242 domain-containing protein [Gemmatimonadaceae bacterium]
MRRYVIERDLPGVGGFSPDQIRDASKASCDAVLEVGTGIQWEHSYVTADRLYCIYLADSEQLVREHAKRAGLPANRVVEVKLTIDPLSANSSGV